MIVNKIILRLLGSSDDKEKIGVARPEGLPLGKMNSPVQSQRRSAGKGFTPD